ncbi:MAG: hypothetical protein KDC49_17415 [Saprospiraceae bacterium]|nr:hypothetical protein [Saprospiraceae bacterium]
MFDKLTQLPTPWQILMDPASIIVISIFVALMIAEALFPGRKLPTIKYWRLKGITAFIIYFFVSSYLPLIWSDYLAEYRVFDLSFLGDYWGGLIALIIYQFGVYVWHRSMHKSNVLY